MGIHLLWLIILLFQMSSVGWAQDFGSSSQTTSESRNVFSSYDPTDDILSAFGASCSTLGQNTLQAINQTAALKGIIESLKNDSSCVEINRALDGVVESGSYMANLLSPSFSGWQFTQRDARITQLVTAISVETSPVVADSLTLELAREKIETLKLGFETDYRRREMLYSAAGNYLLYSERALAALSARSSCIASHPKLGVQVAGQILAMSAPLTTSPLGPIFFGVGHTVNHLVQYFTSRGYGKLLKKATTARLSVALGCVFESLSNSYCQARDSLALIDANSNLTTYNGNVEPEWSGITLLKRDLSNYNTWINRIVAGAPPANQAAATQKSRGDLYEAGLRIASSKMQADLQTGLERESRAPINQKANMRRLVLSDLELRIKGYLTEAGTGSGLFTGGTGLSEQSPFFYVFLYDPLCGPKNYLLTGIHAVTVTGTGSNAGCPPEVQNPPDDKIPDIETLKSYVFKLLDEAGVTVANEVALYRENDFLSALAQSELSGNLLNVAQEFLVKVDLYLASLQSTYQNQIPLYTGQLIADTRRIIAATFVALKSDQPLETKVALIQQILAPKLDQYFLAKRLNDIVQWDLTEKLKAGLPPHQLILIFQDSLRDVLESPKEAGVLQLDKLKGDAFGSQSVTHENLILVEQLFDDQLESILKNLHKKIQNAHAATPADQQQLRVLCMQALALPSGPNVTRSLNLNKYCRGQQWNSTYLRSELKLTFDSLVNLPFENRVCSVYDFYRKSNIWSRGLLR